MPIAQGCEVIFLFLKSMYFLGTSLVVQWLRICLPMQGTLVRALVWEDPHAAEQLSPCATTTEAACHNYCSLRA